MRTIANRYIDEISKPAAPLPTFKQIKKVLFESRHVIVFGFLSVTLYAVLYQYSNQLIEIAQNAHHGKKALFFMPIIIALVFSLVHGSFTSHFWDALGVKAKTS